MPRRTIDVVALGPPSPDLYDPAAPAWALAAGLAARGHAVQVTFPGPPETHHPPAAISLAPFSAVTPHVGTALGDAELAREAAHRLRPDANAIIREPVGLGALGHHRGGRPVIAFVRSLAVDTEDAGAEPPTHGGILARLTSGGGTGQVRKLEREALHEAAAICCATAGLRDRLRKEYGVPPDRLRVVPPAVPEGPEPPSRAVARRHLGVPDDILLAILLPPVDPAATAAAAPCVEAFERTRPIFPGVRLGVVGGPDISGPGVHPLPSREAEMVATAAAAADIAIAYAPGTTLDPGLVVAMRAGVPTLVPPAFDLGEGADSAVRRVPTTDAGELASVLAELLADPAARQALGDGARTFAKRHAPARIAEELEKAGALGAG